MSDILLKLSICIVMACALAGQAVAADLEYPTLPRVSRVLLENTPSRPVAIGYANQFNVVVDSVKMTPLFIWYGPFIDFGRETRGRGGGACRINGERINLDLPEIPLRIGDFKTKPREITFEGYRRPGKAAPVLLATIDGHSLSVTVTESKAYEVAINVAFLSDRKKPAYFLTGKIRQENIVLPMSAAWQEDGVIKVPADIKSFQIKINTINNQRIVIGKQKVTGKLLYQTNCSACHTTNGQKLIGPTFKGLFGTKRKVLAGGAMKTVSADIRYLERAVISPHLEVVQGFEAVPMPSYKEILQPEEIKLLIEYIKTVK